LRRPYGTPPMDFVRPRGEVASPLHGPMPGLDRAPNLPYTGIGRARSTVPANKEAPLPANSNKIEKRLWEAADELRANSRLRSAEYSAPVLGLIFLRYADHRFAAADAGIQSERKKAAKKGLRQPPVSPLDYQARGVLYLPDNGRFENLVALPERVDIGRAINEAMKEVEKHNPDLNDVLPKTFNRFQKNVLRELLRIFNSIPMDIEGDVFGRIYEYFLGKFAAAEGARAGEFFTATSIVRLIVEIIEPFHGLILDPACGSGGMFVQSARFVERHQGQSRDVSIYGQDRVEQTVRLCKMNLAVHGLAGDIRQGNSYYEDIHESLGRFDFVMANPPFNVNKVDKDRLKDDPHYPFGLPRADNANYLWIQLFFSALNDKGRAGFVMANSAADARASEMEIRKQLIQSGAVDVVVAVGPNFFYNVTLPVTLWFLDKGKPEERRDQVLFVDARQIFTQVDRSHREFAPQQIEFLANIVRLYRGRESESSQGSTGLMSERFPESAYRDVLGLCCVATTREIEDEGWSLNPGRYVGVALRLDDDIDFTEQLTGLHKEFETLSAEAHKLEALITDSVRSLLEKTDE
jgi:type I restriction enzyme M protein